jgi:hypothetical protein
MHTYTRGFSATLRTFLVVRALWTVENVCPEGALVGFRALSARGGDVFDAIIGSIDATGKGSVLLDDYPEGGGIHCFHYRIALPDHSDGGPVSAELVREIPDLRNVEGVSFEEGRVFYVTDEDERIALRF